MAQTSSDVQTYMRQWVQTATKGNVKVEFAWFQNRMEMRCKACHAIYRVDAPQEPTEIAWDIQKWVARHAPGGIHDKEEIALPTAPIPLTADFKKMHPLPTASGGQTGIVDLSSTKAEIIKAQMEKYKAEQEALDLDKKIKWLKLNEEEKAKQKAQSDKDAKEQAMLNLLQIMQKMTSDSVPLAKLLKPEKVSAAPIVPEPPKPKPVKIVSGRRFR